MVYMIITPLIGYIRYVKMQFNDVIKSIGWYRPFVALLIQINMANNSTDTNTGISIGALTTTAYIQFLTFKDMYVN